MKIFQKDEFNILWKIYLGYFIKSILFLVPAFALIYFINLGFSLTQIGFLFAAEQIAMILFEIPTGAIADKFGRKFSVLIGLLLETLILFTLFFFTSYYALLILFFVLGIVYTLSSGSEESWIYDLIKKKNKKIIYSYYSKEQIFKTTGLVLGGILGAIFVANFGLRGIWIISGISSLLYLLILSSLEEIYTLKKEYKTPIKDIWVKSTNSLRYSFKHPVLFWIFLSGFFMIISAVFSESLAYVPYLKSLGFPEYAFGYFFSGISLVLAFSPLCTKLFKGKKKEISFLIWATFIGSVIIFLTYFAREYLLAIIIILVATFFYGIKYPIERPFMQKFIPTKNRATILSIQSMIYSLAGAIALPFGGFLIDKLGPLNVILISALLGIPSILAYLLIKIDKKEREK